MRGANMQDNPTLILDCRYGARKSALVASLLGLLSDELREEFISKFNKIGIDGVSIGASKKRMDGIECCEFEVLSDGEVETFSSNHAHGHEHHSRSLADVSYIIETLTIDGKASNDAIGVYGVLADGEAEAHGAFPDSVHFHEVGNNFAIASIVAFCMLVNEIGPDRIVATPITTGFGFVNCAHGRIAIPAPATANILRGLPNEVGNIEGELTTPTGAALVSYFASEFIDGDDVDKRLEQAKRAVQGYGVDNKRFGSIRSILEMR